MIPIPINALRRLFEETIPDASFSKDALIILRKHLLEQVYIKTKSLENLRIIDLKSMETVTQTKRFITKTKDGKIFTNYLFQHFEKCFQEGQLPHLKSDKELGLWMDFCEKYHPEEGK